MSPIDTVHLTKAPKREPALVIIPVLNCWTYTNQAIHDALAQTTHPLVLVVDNGSDDGTREALDTWRMKEPRLLAWHHDPPLPSLSATWNRALRFAWAGVWDLSGAPVGDRDVLVINNDVRLHPETYAILRRRMRAENALFVSGVGVHEEDWTGPVYDALDQESQAPSWYPPDTGGPDFSCCLITAECATRFPFDEAFIPAYHEDNDLHRRIILAGEGHRIFGCAVPFLHYGSRTANQSPAFTEAFHAKFSQSADYYQRKWGGPVGAERFVRPFGEQLPDHDDRLTPHVAAQLVAAGQGSGGHDG